jgi:ubiquinone/menaquinone biosynthesis C-methylase UbiE
MLLETATQKFSETADIKTSSADYASRFTGKVGEWFLQVQEEATLKLLAPYPGMKILDVGGGHGQITKTLIQSGCDVTVLGSDSVCQQRIQHFIDKGQCQFKVGDILNLPFPDHSFDAVISYRLLAHVSQWQTYLTELARMTKQAVLIDYAEVYSFNYFEPYLFQYKKQIEGNTRTYTCFKKSDLLPIFHKGGLVYADDYRQFFLPMVLHRKLNKVALSTIAENISQSLGLTRLMGSPVILKMVRE